MAHFIANHFVPLFPLLETGPCEGIPVSGFERDTCDDIPEERAFNYVFVERLCQHYQAQLVDAASQMAQVNFMEEEDGRYHWPS